MDGRLRPLATFAALAALVSATQARAAEQRENVIGAVCALIDSSALAETLPVAFLTRLIWQESNFRSDAISPAGARGVAQFMPATANARGLADPFDPEAAIPEAAALLSQLRDQFGNLGLAAAAYNAGPARVARFVAGEQALPAETEAYVAIVTKHSPQEWRGKDAAKLVEAELFPDASCVQIVAKFRTAEPTLFARSPFWAPWGVQIAGAFSKAAALRQYKRAEARYAAILGGVEPMVLAGRLMNRGFGAFYRVRAPAQTRAEAQQLCAKLRKVGGACVVLRST
jgi:soluble lytic murein transglycosylase-like protein